MCVVISMAVHTYRYVFGSTEEEVCKHGEEGCVEAVAWRQRGEQSKGQS